MPLRRRLYAAMLAIPSLSFSQVPRGVFSIANSGKLPEDAVLANPNVDGITVRQDWAALEPTEGNFDFSLLDSAVARAPVPTNKSCCESARKPPSRLG